MARDIPVGNGSMLVSFDKDYMLREFYFPHVGEENHAAGHQFRFGVWVNGEFSWLSEGWDIVRNYIDDTLVTNVELVNDRLKVRIVANDLVDFHENVYLKKLIIENLSDETQYVRLFLCQDFHINGNNVGDTAAFKPEANGILHYKGERYFLINVCADSKCGAGHFVKMVHNGIEYAIMEAYGEGFEMLKNSPYGEQLNPGQVAHLWNQGSVIRSWLLELLESAFEKDPDLSTIKGYVEDSGEGRWTVQEAVDMGVSVPVIALSLFRRFQSRQEDLFSDKVLAALRNEFGGHTVKKQ